MREGKIEGDLIQAKREAAGGFEMKPGRRVVVAEFGEDPPEAIEQHIFLDHRRKSSAKAPLRRSAC